MSKRTSIAVFGAGRWGVHFVRNFLNSPQAELMAIVDPNPERLATLQQQYQLGNQVELTADWESVIARPGLDAVVIVTPASMHYPIIEKALQLGRHVLAEKPLTLDPEECDRLCQLAQQQQRQLFIDHTYLFHPAVQTGQQFLQTQGVGEIRYGYATRTHLGPVRQDVDALWDLAIHDISILNLWTGETPIQVQATGTVWLQKEPILPLFPQGLPDVVWATLTYPSGFQATLHLCWCNPDKQRRLAIVGSRGTLIFDEMNRETPLSVEWGEFEQQQGRFSPIQQRREALSIPGIEPLREVCDRFLDAVSQNQSQHQPVVQSSGEVGAQLVRILSALTASLNQQGQPVQV